MLRERKEGRAEGRNINKEERIGKTRKKGGSR